MAQLGALCISNLCATKPDEVEEFDTSLICLSLMCAVGIKASFIFFTTTLSINKIVSIIFLILFTIFSLIHILTNVYVSFVKRKYG
ncbi:hypothetical protein [Acinetobacter baumannii]|uniref:hypothetical protein n=1 Tax=Acinetobacter baumannii TaxID=470 RepID=UPI001D17B40F|nr:hypothetical protein [Acinetobacter baumannii]